MINAPSQKKNKIKIHSIVHKINADEVNFFFYRPLSINIPHFTTSLVLS